MTQVLTAFCDLEVVPVSYDVPTWLVHAKLEQERRKLNKLHVVFVPNEKGLAGLSRHWGPHDAAAVQWRFWRIAAASCPLIGASMSLAPDREYADSMRKASLLKNCWWPTMDRPHLARHLVERARAGAAMPRFHASAAALRYVSAWLDGTRPVTLTLRNQENDPSRNSDPFHWEALAEWLKSDQGLRVIKLADSHDAVLEGRGHIELDLDLRLALYELSSLNIVGNNGPAALLWHSKAPYLRVAAGETRDWESNLGLKKGEQVPWAYEGQRLLYGDASFERMRDAVKEWSAEGSSWIL